MNSANLRQTYASPTMFPFGKENANLYTKFMDIVYFSRYLVKTLKLIKAAGIAACAEIQEVLDAQEALPCLFVQELLAALDANMFENYYHSLRTCGGKQYESQFMEQGRHTTGFGGNLTNDGRFGGLFAGENSPIYLQNAQGALPGRTSDSRQAPQGGMAGLAATGVNHTHIDDAKERSLPAKNAKDKPRSFVLSMSSGVVIVSLQQKQALLARVRQRIEAAQQAVAVYEQSVQSAKLGNRRQHR